jgi:hypothetical protein
LGVIPQIIAAKVANMVAVSIDVHIWDSFPRGEQYRPK